MKIVTLLIAASFVCVALPAHAGVCTEEIEMVSQLLSGGAAAPSVGSVAPAAPSTSALSSVTGGGAAASALGSGAGLPPVRKHWSLWNRPRRRTPPAMKPAAWNISGRRRSYSA